MSKEIHYTKDMKCCPYCGNDEFYMKQSYKGVCEYNMKFDLEDTRSPENGSMWDMATMKDEWKYVRCNRCDKRLFPIEEYYKEFNN